MTDSLPPLDERISALMDGALHAQECAGAVQQMLDDPEGARIWHRFHVVGDALRSVEPEPVGDDHAFWDRLSHRLGQETGRPHGVGQGIALPLAANALPQSARTAANAPIWKWKLLAGAASVALVSVVALGLWTRPAAPDGPQMAAQTRPEPLPALSAVEGQGGIMLRDPYLDQLMAAHQQLGGHSALQAPSGFLRNATYQGPAR